MLKASSAVDLVEGLIPKQPSHTSKAAVFFTASYSMARGNPSSQASVVQVEAPKTTYCQGCCKHRCWHPVLDTMQALWVTCLWVTANTTSAGSATRMPTFFALLPGCCMAMGICARTFVRGVQRQGPQRLLCSACWGPPSMPSAKAGYVCCVVCRAVIAFYLTQHFVLCLLCMLQSPSCLRHAHSSVHVEQQSIYEPCLSAHQQCYNACVNAAVGVRDDSKH